MAKVVLLQDVPSVGKKGAILDIKEGYAVNFLFPKKLARFATAADERKAGDLQKQAEDAARNKQKLVMKLIAFASTQLVKKPIKIPVKTAVGGRVFGNIDASQVVAGLYESMPQLKTLDASEFQIKVPQRIESIGKYVFEMTVNLDGADRKDVTVIPLYVDVVSNAESRVKKESKS